MVSAVNCVAFIAAHTQMLFHHHECTDPKCNPKKVANQTSPRIIHYLCKDKIATGIVTIAAALAIWRIIATESKTYI